MYKHIEDNGDIHMLVNSKGETLLVCAECGRRWHGRVISFKDDKPPSHPQKYFAKLHSAGSAVVDKGGQGILEQARGGYPDIFK
ncbi:hypothetical protein KFV02_06400 [Desulfohalobiaceae bacterium Ax17]|uniref:hypothetical protein n=1 Tax=Desulfovulcanus ferrireducens TaxID=2831190 RepID=UPI00207BBF27|nr:hypothetical protein [Desulfovulcanus ferrireducens]MBT8763561.1 hypothetical protein [Desulfovulcanus ferrireducens]